MKTILWAMILTAWVVIAMMQINLTKMGKRVTDSEYEISILRVGVADHEMRLYPGIDTARYIFKDLR